MVVKRSDICSKTVRVPPENSDVPFAVIEQLLQEDKNRALFVLISSCVAEELETWGNRDSVEIVKMHEVARYFDERLKEFAEQCDKIYPRPQKYCALFKLDQNISAASLRDQYIGAEGWFPNAQIAVGKTGVFPEAAWENYVEIHAQGHEVAVGGPDDLVEIFKEWGLFGLVRITEREDIYGDDPDNVINFDIVVLGRSLHADESFITWGAII